MELDRNSLYVHTKQQQFFFVLAMALVHFCVPGKNNLCVVLLRVTFDLVAYLVIMSNALYASKMQNYYYSILHYSSQHYSFNKAEFHQVKLFC